MSRQSDVLCPGVWSLVPGEPLDLLPRVIVEQVVKWLEAGPEVRWLFFHVVGRHDLACSPPNLPYGLWFSVDEDGDAHLLTSTAALLVARRQLVS